MLQALFFLNLDKLCIHAILESIMHHTAELILIFLSGIAAYFVTLHYIPQVAQVLFNHNLFGLDINKTTPEERRVLATKPKACATSPDKSDVLKIAVPESLGILAGAVYLSVVILLIFLLQDDISSLSGAFTTISTMLLLGFVDDVLNVRWRYKIVFSILGSVPLVLGYKGSTSILLSQTVMRYVESAWSYLTPPLPFLRPKLKNYPWVEYTEKGLMLFIGPFYLFYLSMLCVFCTNSINILAGINGLELGQSIVIAIGCVIYNLVQLRLEVLYEGSRQNSFGFSANSHIRAVLLLVPFIGVSMALLKYNRYPAKIFVGDSYTYFAGTVLAVAGITGKYSKTLFLFFTPQLLNFLISLPQLLNIVRCPPHRVPRWIPSKDALTNSGNYTLLNLILLLFGDMHEKTLTTVMITIQFVASIFAFIIRYLVASWLFDQVH